MSEARILFFIRGSVVGRKQCRCPNCRSGGWHDHGYLIVSETVVAGDSWTAIERVENKVVKHLKGCEKVRWVTGPFFSNEPLVQEALSLGARVLERLRTVWQAAADGDDGLIHALRSITEDDSDNPFVVIGDWGGSEKDEREDGE